MKLLEEAIRETSPVICRVSADYAEYLHSIDWRVSEKWQTRTYVGLAVRINGNTYVIPLTSQTTPKRIARGKRRRSPQLTSFIFSRGEEIANLLHNNMFPVPDKEITIIEIDSKTDTYLSNEVRYIRKHWVEINTKAIDVFRKRCDHTTPNYDFFEKTCCDFRALERACKEWMNK